jgi:predicted pyridoxine 5'-phosphate oxidase superfamily flavin-nucleotide-binding protein
MFDLTRYAEPVNAALSDGTPCVLATADGEGRPDLGFKGSMLVLDPEHLAYWERTRGQHLTNVRANPHVAVFYFNRARKLSLRFFGDAEIFERGPEWDRIMARVVSPELERDPERLGLAVRIRVDTVLDPAAGGRLTRNT